MTTKSKFLRYWGIGRYDVSGSNRKDRRLLFRSIFDDACTENRSRNVLRAVHSAFDSRYPSHQFATRLIVSTGSEQVRGRATRLIALECISWHKSRKARKQGPRRLNCHKITTGIPPIPPNPNAGGSRTDEA